jgi:hypothetical protein
MKAKEEEELRRAEANMSTKEQIKARIALGKMQKQNLNQAKANQARLEKTVRRKSLALGLA